MNVDVHGMIEHSFRSVRLSGCKTFRYRKIKQTSDQSVANEAYQPRFHLVLKGQLVFHVPQSRTPISVSAGELFLASHGNDYFVNEAGVHAAGAVQANHSIDSQSLIAEINFENNYPAELFRSFPDFMHLKADDLTAKDWLVTFARLLEIEIDTGESSSVFVDRFLELLVLETIRSGTRIGLLQQGFVQGMRDKRIMKVLSSLHHSPEDEWTVSSMADVAAMSRSSFAERFVSYIGQTPQNYLLNIRIRKACELIDKKNQPIGSIAEAVGYRSKAAFTRAFTRITGVTPARYRNGG